MKHLVLKIEDGGLWIEGRPSRLKDFIMPRHEGARQTPTYG